MKKIPLLRYFHWRLILMRILVNAATLVVIAVLLPNIGFENRPILSAVFLGLILGVLNAVVKPILQFLTLPFIFASFGLVVVLVNSFMLLVLGLLFPQLFSIHGLLALLIAGALFGAVSSVLESLFGLSAPILPEEMFEERERIKEQSVSPVQKMIERRGLIEEPAPGGAAEALPAPEASETAPDLPPSDQSGTTAAGAPEAPEAERGVE
jgi:putative membrane protein